MKQYIRPTAEVVELSVKENIAALPAALKSVSVEQAPIGNQNVILTTYNLAATSTSDPVQG